MPRTPGLLPLADSQPALEADLRRLEGELAALCGAAAAERACPRAVRRQERRAARVQAARRLLAIERRRALIRHELLGGDAA